LPNTSTTEEGVYFDIEDLMNNAGVANYKGKRPVVIHPEGTKTNGLGVLDIEVDLVQMIGVAAKTLKIHSFRFDYEFRYWAPMNTTDEEG
jgi:hypothetical protein